MITNAPHHAHIAGSVATALDDRPHGLLAWFLAWLQQTLCALHGHDSILQYERNRIFLRCTSCGHETPGWEVSNTDPVRTRAAARAPLTASGDLAVARKIA